MSKFYSFNNFNNNVTINSGFNYNRYEKKETLTNHTEILKSNSFNNKEIYLDINLKINYSHNVEKYISEINRDYLSNISDIKLNKYQKAFFNNLGQKNDFLIKNYQIENENLENIFNFFSVNFINFEEDFNRNKKLHISRNKKKYIEKCNINNVFFENSILHKNDNIEFYKNADQQKENIENKDNFISDFIPYNSKNIYDSPEVYFCFVGFFIEKYYKENEKYISLDSRFFVDNDIFRINSRSINNKALSIKDIGIQYGKVYKYKILPVYSMTLPKFNDFHVVEDYLFCDVPIFTEDIICQESTRPLPPTSIRFKYDKSKNNMNIRWNLIPDPVGDIKGFQIFKRSSLKDPYTLVKQIEYHDKYDFYKKNNLIDEEFVEKKDEVDCFYIDVDIRKEKIEIYTICSIDAHGFVSNYSSQLGVKFNHSTRKIEIDLVSRSGAPINMPNLLIDRKTKYFFNDDKITTITPKCNNVEKISIYATPDFATINTDELQEQNIYTYKENYKFNIFKLENSENFIDTIKIVNFNI